MIRQTSFKEGVGTTATGGCGEAAGRSHSTPSALWAGGRVWPRSRRGRGGGGGWESRRGSTQGEEGFGANPADRVWLKAGQGDQTAPGDGDDEHPLGPSLTLLSYQGGGRSSSSTDLGGFLLNSGQCRDGHGNPNARAELEKGPGDPE